ncbi:carboxymuconolactone decarboxylase family protein [Sphingobacterium faecium]|uniref:carboxymuconolactone decarboxylase family protein n=1 Tax=Sphingobacterium faecium TaxID=34087 RepID=UPI0032090363
MIKKRKFILAFILTLFCQVTMLYARQGTGSDSLNIKEKSLVRIAATTASGDQTKLKVALNKGLDDGLTINQIKEGIIHLYAYAGFPRSIRGLQTLMAVIEERKAKGINDQTGADASPIRNDQTKYERGKAILEKLTGMPEKDQKTGYAAFAPTIEVFLKEHLFADIFERDVLSFKERELVTVSVLSAIGGVEPMLQSHLKICLNVGLTPTQLHQFVAIIGSTIGKKESVATNKILNEVLHDKK